MKCTIVAIRNQIYRIFCSIVSPPTEYLLKDAGSCQCISEGYPFLNKGTVQKSGFFTVFVQYEVDFEMSLR